MISQYAIVDVGCSERYECDITVLSLIYMYKSAFLKDNGQIQWNQ